MASTFAFFVCSTPPMFLLDGLLQGGLSSSRVWVAF
jgi:hypothetical protein